MRRLRNRASSKSDANAASPSARASTASSAMPFNVVVERGWFGDMEAAFRWHREVRVAEAAG